MVSIDYSPVVIDRMKQRYPTLDCAHHDQQPALLHYPSTLTPANTGRVADATTLADFASGSVDVAIDKGTLDALLCGPGSTERAAAMLASVARVRHGACAVCRVLILHSP